MGSASTKCTRPRQGSETSSLDHLPTTQQFTVLLIAHQTDRCYRKILEVAQSLGSQCTCQNIDYAAAAAIDGASSNSAWVKELEQLKHHDLVIIDRRAQKRCLGVLQSKFRSESTSSSSSSVERTAADAICQKLKSLANLRNSTIVAIVPQRFDKSSSQLSSALQAGFNKFIGETSDKNTIRMHFLSFVNNELGLLRSLQQYMPRVSIDFSRNVLSTQYRPSFSTSIDSRSTVLHQDEVKNQILESIAQIHRKASKISDQLPLHGSRPPSKSICTGMLAMDRYPVEVMLKGDRSTSYHLGGPLCKALGILSRTKSRCSNTLEKEIQKAIDLVYYSENFAQQIRTPECEASDALRDDFVGGLMKTNNISRLKSNLPKSHSIISTDKFRQGDWTQEMKDCFKLVDEWEFDILMLERISQHKPLRYLGMEMFERFHMSSVLKISSSTFAEWLAVIESKYHPANTYHNATHAADVTQAAAYFLRLESVSPVFDSFDECAVILASIIHDLDHPGRTNPFLINNGHPLAIVYNDLTVLESHHVALAFNLTLANKSINIFQNLNRDDFKAIRGGIIDMVLSTEMVRHFEIVNQFEANIKNPIAMIRQVPHSSYEGSNESVSSRDMTQIPGSSETQLPATPGTPTSKSSTESMNANILAHLTTPESRLLIKRLIIKCSDVNNQTRSLEVCKEWSTRITTEYFNQTEEEQEKGLPVVMPSFDRKTCDIPKSQTGFIEFFLNGMFSTFDTVFPITTLMQNLKTNHDYWSDCQMMTDKSPNPEAMPTTREADDD